ncbi:MAG: PAS domain-containing sensor histidine kinase [Gammaproteobacteria bacterium]|nr:PAS domain-containing sensor histidine kinase [Gammaproteobacteria bacterium]MBU2225381.1 PAS domain-containing sensor histidine kinase [Gammaproteobacteria bacterium]MBU2280143.1 PAS domain-containing sensor histidine kinase [Gammaproteobacteria bacterium]
MKYKDVPFNRQHWLLALAFTMLVLLSIVFLFLSFKGFEEVDQTWRQYSDQNEKMTASLSAVRSHWGYGGFIHNFKNLVLRRDITQYQPLIEKNSEQLDLDLAGLRSMFNDPASQQAITQLADTFTQYKLSYQKTLQLIQIGALSDAIDAQVKVSDRDALAALQILESHIAATTKAMRTATETQNAHALQFLLYGALLLMPAIVVVAVLFLSFLRRILTARAWALQAQVNLTSLFHSTPDPMLVILPDGKLERCNQMAVDFFGVDEQQLLAMSLPELLDVKPGDPSDYLQQLQVTNDEGRTIIAAFTKGHQTQRMVAITMSATELAPGVSITLMLRDVTQQLADRQALIAAKTQAELALLRQKEIQEELVKSEKLASLSKLVAGVAHEINTPVGIMLTASTLLRDETNSYDELFKNKTMTHKQLLTYFTLASESSSLICNNCLRAAELIQSFKQVAVDQSSAERRCFNVAAYLHEVLLSLRSCWKNTNINVTVDCALDIEMDSYPGSFAQVLTNLVLNAIRHGYFPGEAGQVTVQVIRLEEPANWIEMQVKDDGHGIAEVDRDKVFEPFFTTKRNNGGTGLGLHIVQSAVEMVLAGKITFHSEVNVGSCFSVQLPLDISTYSAHILEAQSAYTERGDDLKLMAASRSLATDGRTPLQ